MEIQEIIYRDSKKTFQQDEMVYVIEHYIKIRKNKNIKIIIIPIPFMHIFTSQITKLVFAFVSACEWLKLNTYKK